MLMSCAMDGLVHVYLTDVLATNNVASPQTNQTKQKSSTDNTKTKPPQTPLTMPAPFTASVLGGAADAVSVFEDGSGFAVGCDTASLAVRQKHAHAKPEELAQKLGLFSNDLLAGSGDFRTAATVCGDFSLSSRANATCQRPSKLFQRHRLIIGEARSCAVPQSGAPSREPDFFLRKFDFAKVIDLIIAPYTAQAQERSSHP